MSLGESSELGAERERERELFSAMPARNPECGARGASGSSVLRFSPAVSSRSSHRRRSSALLPSVLTFAVIVASGGLLLLIEKGMLNGMHTPSPLANGKKADYRVAPRDPAVDVDSQVSYAEHRKRSSPSCGLPEIHT